MNRRQFLQLSAAMAVASQPAISHAGRRRTITTYTHRIYILAGQSNMVGHGDSSLLTQAQADLPSNALYYRNGTQITSFYDVSTFGPEVAFVPVICDTFPNVTNVFVKWGAGGTNLAINWLPPSGGQYVSMINAVHDVADPLDCVFGGLLWFQGCADSNDQTMADDYYTNLVALIAAIRSEFSTPGLRTIVGKINCNTQYVKTVQHAQRDVSFAISNVGLCPSVSLTKETDNVHYDTAGQLELGARFADLL